MLSVSLERRARRDANDMLTPSTARCAVLRYASAFGDLRCACRYWRGHVGSEGMSGSRLTKGMNPQVQDFWHPSLIFDSFQRDRIRAE
jgi:hypothetical protein